LPPHAAVARAPAPARMMNDRKQGDLNI
jgi:hypothetical protein